MHEIKTIGQHYVYIWPSDWCHQVNLYSQGWPYTFTPVVDIRTISLVTHYHPPISRRLLSTADWSHHPRIKYFKQKDTCSWQQQTTRNPLKTTLYINKELVFNTDSERSGQNFSDISECLSIIENSFECWSKFTDVCSQVFRGHQVNTGSDKSLALNMRQIPS